MKKRILVPLLILLAVLTAGCARGSKQYEKIGEADYTVAEEPSLPKELMELIHEKWEKPFRMTFLTEDSLYVVQGFGEQPTGGYSVSAEEVYLAEEGICVSFLLTGPKADRQVLAARTYPFLVLRFPASEVDVIFLR